MRQPVGITLPDRRLHTYVVGQTGTGKSTLVLNLIVQDVSAGRGVGVLDPHGELIADILERIPLDRVDDVVLLDAPDHLDIALSVLCQGSADEAKDSYSATLRSLSEARDCPKLETALRALEEQMKRHSPLQGAAECQHLRHVRKAELVDKWPRSTSP